MRQLPRLHLGVLVLGWVLAATWGTAGVLAVTGMLLVVQLAFWRADLASLPSFRRVWGRRNPRPHPMPSYDAVRHAVRLGAHSRREFDLGLRRRLERVASSRLADSHGVDLHHDDRAPGYAGTARELLGETAWDLVDPRRPVSDERGRGGVPETTMRDVIDRLEKL